MRAARALALAAAPQEAQVAQDEVPLTVELHRAAARIERRAYREGWLYGLVCGLVAGAYATAVLIVLIDGVAAALRCSSC